MLDCGQVGSRTGAGLGPCPNIDVASLLRGEAFSRLMLNVADFGGDTHLFFSSLLRRAIYSAIELKERCALLHQNNQKRENRKEEEGYIL